MKFYLDENVDPAVAAALRLRGIDAIATQEVAQKGFSDERPIAFAATEGRVTSRTTLTCCDGTVAVDHMAGLRSSARIDAPLAT